MNPAGPLQLQVILVPPVLLAVSVNTSFSQIGFGVAVAVRVVMGSSTCTVAVTPPVVPVQGDVVFSIRTQYVVVEVGVTLRFTFV